MRHSLATHPSLCFSSRVSLRRRVLFSLLPPFALVSASYRVLVWDSGKQVIKLGNMCLCLRTMGIFLIFNFKPLFEIMCGFPAMLIHRLFPWFIIIDCEGYLLCHPVITPPRYVELKFFSVTSMSLEPFCSFYICTGRPAGTFQAIKWFSLIPMFHCDIFTALPSFTCVIIFLVMLYKLVKHGP